MLIGVVSRGIGCGRDDSPGIYTRVTQYISWIYKYIKKSGQCTKTKKPKSRKSKSHVRNSGPRLKRRKRIKKKFDEMKRKRRKRRRRNQEGHRKMNHVTRKVTPKPQQSFQFPSLKFPSKSEVPLWIGTNPHRHQKIYFNKRSKLEEKFIVSQFHLKEKSYKNVPGLIQSISFN